MFDIYVMSGCPYCRKVLTYLDENSIPYHKFDTSNPENAKRLLELGGKDQVPFLHDENSDVKMYESDDIIEYVKKYQV